MKFGICGNLEKSELPEVIERLIVRLNTDKVPYVLSARLARGLREKIDPMLLKKSTVAGEDALALKCDILISLGGDGTILKSARLLSEKPKPILGINLGKLGFLAEISVEELDDCLQEILRGEYRIEERMMLRARVGKSTKMYYALNDIVLDLAGSSRMVSIRTFVNDEYLSTFTGDGIIIATPTGSTGYVLSNGGPIVTPTSRLILISPICPHTLTARTVIVSGDARITLNVETAPGKIHVAVDGQPEVFVKPGLEVIVEKSPYAAKLVKRLNTSYFDVLRRKLHWGQDVRNSRDAGG
jgi:NAD+ kinase